MISTFLDLTIRVGCHLTYEATAPTPVVFMLRPRLDDAHLVTVEKRSFEPGLPSNEFQDSRGNRAWSRCRHRMVRNRSHPWCRVVRLEYIALPPGRGRVF